MIVRVVEVAERRGWAWIASLVAGLTAAAVVAHLFNPHHLFGFSKFWSFGISTAMWCIATLLPRRAQPYVARAWVDGAVFHFGEHTIPLREITVAVARAERGFSIAIGRDSRAGVFLEVELEADARRLLEQLGVSWPGSGGVGMDVRRENLRWAHWGVGLFGAISALLYAIIVAGFDGSGYKGAFGLPAIVLGIAASVLFVVEPLFRRRLLIGKDVVDGNSVMADHLRLHAWHGVISDEPPAVRSDDVRGRVLERGDETTRAWIARLDAVGASGGGEGYRGGALTAEELRTVAEDGAASTHARLGALRLLAHRPEGLPEEVRMRIAEELGPRARVVTESEPDVAAEAFDALGPAFRAKADVT